MQGLSGAPWLLCCECGEVLVVDLGTFWGYFDDFHSSFCTAVPMVVIGRAGYVFEVPVLWQNACNLLQ